MHEHDILDAIEALFDETATAHHRAFRQTDGADPEWPLWYAEHLHAELNKLLGSRMTRSELVYLLVTVDREHSLVAPGSKWQRYYTGFFAERYL